MYLPRLRLPRLRLNIALRMLAALLCKALAAPGVDPFLARGARLWPATEAPLERARLARGVYAWDVVATGPLPGLIVPTAHKPQARFSFGVGRRTWEDARDDEAPVNHSVNFPSSMRVMLVM